MITLKKLKEEVDLAQNVRNGDISVDKNPVRENINNLLTTALSCSFVTPYVGLEKVSKVLANFHMHLPKAPYLEGNHGVQVFDLNQFGEMMGMKNDGTVVTKVETPYHVYFEYQMNDKGRYDIFCEVVDDEELDELLDEMEDDMNDVEDDKRMMKEQNSYMSGPGGIRNTNTRPATPMTPEYQGALRNVQQKSSDNFWSGARTVVPGAQAAHLASKGDYSGAATSAATDLASTAAAVGLGKIATTALSKVGPSVAKALSPAAAYSASKPPAIAGAQYKSSLEPPEDNISNTLMSSKPEVQNMPNTNTTASTKPEVQNMPNIKTTASTKPEVQNISNTNKELNEEGKKGTYRPGMSSPRKVDIANAAKKADKALDNSYGYGTSGNISPIAATRRKQGFGAAANYNSAEFGIRAASRSNNLRSVSNAVHKGWGKTVDELPAPNPEKQESRKKLKRTAYSELSKAEQEKDNVIARAIMNLKRKK